MAVSVADCPEQVVTELTDTVKALPIVMVPVPVPEQPLLVPVTVYVSVEDGDSVMEAVVAPVDQT